METDATDAIQILVALSALPVVVFALWNDYYARHLDELKQSRETEGAAMEIQRVRSAGLFAMMLQALFFLSTTELRQELPLYLQFFPIIGISIQTWLQAGTEKKVREIFKKPALSATTAGSAEPRPDSRSGTRGGPGFARAFAWALVAGFIYLSIMIGALMAATIAARMLDANAWFSMAFMVVGVLTGVLGGLGLNFALGPYYLRQVLCSREVEDPEQRAALTAVFKDARLPEPAFQQAEVGGGIAGAMMTGMRFGTGIFRPTVFVTQGLLKRLDPTELKAVLAHEASHMALRHLRRRFVFSCSMILAIATVSTFLVVLAHVAFTRAGSPESAQWVGLLCGAGAFVSAFKLLAKQSRAHELESDLYCVESLGIQVETLASALRKLETHDPYGSRGPGVTHPSTDARILALRTKLSTRLTSAAASAPAPAPAPAGDERETDHTDRAA